MKHAIEKSEYDLNSEFDIEQHKAHFVNYLEVIIERNGHVLYAVPSHQEKAIELACKEKGWTREQLSNACQPEFYFDFLNWVLRLTGSVSVWNDFYMGELNDIQRKKLIEMKQAGIYRGTI